MARVRHPERSFNFKSAGEWVEVSDNAVDGLVEKYGVEVEGAQKSLPLSDPLDDVSVEVRVNGELIEGKMEQTVETEDPDPVDPDNCAVKTSPGWYEFRGKKYHGLAALPPGVDVLEN